MKLHVGDTVLIISGKERGKKGKIIRILRESNKIVVEKLNMRTKHIKKRGNKAGELVTFEGPIHASNVMYLDGNKPTRIGYKLLADGEKTRIAKTSMQAIIEERPAAKSKSKEK